MKELIKKLSAKGVLAILLAAIMILLIAGYFATRNMKPKRDIIRQITSTTEAQSEETEDTAEDTQTEDLSDSYAAEGESESDTAQP